MFSSYESQTLLVGNAAAKITIDTFKNPHFVQDDVTDVSDSAENEKKKRLIAQVFRSKGEGVRKERVCELEKVEVEKSQRDH